MTGKDFHQRLLINFILLVSITIMSECLTYIHVLIKTNTSRVEDGELRSISEIKKFNPHSECEYIVIVGGPDGNENLLQENVRIFTSDFVFNSVVNCHMDFDKNSL